MLCMCVCGMVPPVYVLSGCVYMFSLLLYVSARAASTSTKYVHGSTRVLHAMHVIIGTHCADDEAFGAAGDE